MALRATNSDQAAASDRGADIHVCRVGIRADVRLGHEFKGADASPCSAAPNATLVILQQRQHLPIQLVPVPILVHHILAS